MSGAAGPVLVVGAGISGLACARALRRARVAARVVERGRVVGGRMASRRFEGRPVDLGAAFFTADPLSPFGAVVQGWLDRGLARPWTDTFWVSDDGGAPIPKPGPLRYAAAAGLRSLVADLAEGLSVDLEHPETDPLDVSSYSAVVLAMPDPQARRLLPEGSPAWHALDDAAGWAPTIAVTLGWPTRIWASDFDGAFLNGSPALTFVADDGRRRGDGAPVLVAHTTPHLAAAHLDDPTAAIPTVTEAVRTLLDIDEPPTWSHAHRWTFARPLAPHPEPYLLARDETGVLGVCGDGWGGSSSVGAAWTSGDALGRALAAD